MKEQILYLECFSGISGDMSVASLLDLGADEKVLREALDSLNVDGYEIEIKRVQKCGIDACSFDVILESEEEHKHSHKCCGNHGHEHHENDHGHTHEHHEHSHEEEHKHS
ncbi:MAG: nickel insertion protein, partial [Clostridia bacterium]